MCVQLGAPRSCPSADVKMGEKRSPLSVSLCQASLAGAAGGRVPHRWGGTMCGGREAEARRGRGLVAGWGELRWREVERKPHRSPGSPSSHPDPSSCTQLGVPKVPALFFFEHAAAAKSLQSCPTLCDPMDCSPPGSSVLGILQARTLE